MNDNLVKFYKTTTPQKCAGVDETGFIVDTANKKIYIGNNSTTPITVADVTDPILGDTVKSANSALSSKTIYLLGHDDSTGNIIQSTVKSLKIRATCDGKMIAGSFYEDSDARLKTFKSNIDIDFEKLVALPKKYFIWNNDSENKLNIGTSAQSVKELYPELVTETEDGYLTVDYSKLSLIALAAIDKLYQDNLELKNEIKYLYDKIQNIENKING